MRRLLIALLLAACGRSEAAVTDLELARHAADVRARAPAGFKVTVAPPFVVVGDCDVDEWARGTVAWAVKHLKQSYFAKDPDHIIDIWLFKDDASYRTHARGLFGKEPTTPYGWYSPQDKALIMNIATGGGTLVHEIVHPFVRANFPEAPAWFNEGLGSLYEQSSERGGRIVGLTNWRLAGLKDVIRAGKLPTFRDLCATDTAAFYTSGTGYAHARYLLYYLQETGKLGDYYRRFQAARETDPTGYTTLVEVLGEKDMTAFQKRWESWVLALVFE